MTDEAVAPLIPNAWYIAAWSNEITDQPVGRTILNQPVVLFRGPDGRAAALEDRCCHRGAPLTHGRVAADGLECGYHGLTFDGSGACVVNPGEDIDAAKLRVRSYPVVERQNFVWIWPGDPALADDSQIIDYPNHDDTDEWPFQYDVYHMECNYMLIIDNLMDITHLGYVHPSTIGGMPKIHVEASQETVKTERGVRFTRWTLDAPAPPTFAKAMPFKGNVDRWAVFEYMSPGTVLQWAGCMDIGRGAQENQDQDGSFRIRLYHGVTPETDTSCFYFWSVANGYRQDDPVAAQELYDDIAPTFLEDKVIIEAQQRNIDREPDRQLLVRQHDEALVLARRALGQLIKQDETAAAA